MKKKEIFIYTLMMFLLSLATVQVVYGAMTGKSIMQITSIIRHTPKLARVQPTANCSNQPQIADLLKSTDPHLRKLGEYQVVCSSKVTDTVMIFTNMPKDSVVAKQNADVMATQLKEFARYDIKPIVVVEPVTDWGLIDFQEFRGGFYDGWIKDYFDELKAQGLTDEQMGTWVPFPEANLPYWNHQNATPEDYAQVVNIYLRTLKTDFPLAHGSILLNSATYANDDFDWRSGEYISLTPYLTGIQTGLVDSLGIQGFPWSPPATTPGPGVFDAAEYVNPELAIEAAETLGVKNIWLNTGSFSRKYTLDSQNMVIFSADKRKDVLNGIVAEAMKLRDKGYNVSINLFAEDKSATDEATDWSYWHTQTIATSPDAIVFANFAARLNREHIGLSLFDQEH